MPTVPICLAPRSAARSMSAAKSRTANRARMPNPLATDNLTPRSPIQGLELTAQCRVVSQRPRAEFAGIPRSRTKAGRNVTASQIRGELDVLQRRHAEGALNVQAQSFHAPFRRTRLSGCVLG